MDPIYDSPLNPFGIEQEKEVYERYSLKELRDKEKCIENLLREKQADEPSRKRKNKMQYDSWVRSIAEWAAELRQVRGEIEKRTSHGNPLWTVLLILEDGKHGRSENRFWIPSDPDFKRIDNVSREEGECFGT